MDIIQAKQILHIADTDGKEEIRQKFRAQIIQYHPDAIGSDLPEHTRRAQEINEAYRILKKSPMWLRIQKKVKMWNSEINEKAYVERNIYMPYHADIDAGHLYQKVVTGKYMWDPEEEEFEMLVKSLHHASLYLLTEVEAPYHLVQDERVLELRFRYQVRLLYDLMRQYVEPVTCLHKLVCPAYTDKNGKEIYRFHAHLGVQGNSSLFHKMESLEEGEELVPVAMKNNRIMVADRKGNELGNLSLKDDALYFCLIPLLKEKCAKVKLTVMNVELDKRHRPYRAKANVELLFRLENRNVHLNKRDGNGRIEALLHNYEMELRSEAAERR